MRTDSYCDSRGENCFSPDKVSSGGNQTVYFNNSKVLFGSTYFRQAGPVDVTFDFTAAGYAPNISRVYIGFDRIKAGGYSLPTAHIIMPGLVNKQLIGGATSFGLGDIVPDNGMIGDWYEIKDGKMSLTVDCQDASCGTNNVAAIRLLGIECAGECRPGDDTGTGIARSCLVNFTYWINGRAGTIARRIYGDQTDRYAVGMWVKDNSSLSLPFTETVYAYNWGASFFDHSERAAVGYFDVDQWLLHKTYLQGLDASNEYKFGTAPLDNGGYVRIANDAVSGIGASVVAIIGRVVSCQ